MKSPLINIKQIKQHHKQLDCGVACIMMVLSHYDKECPIRDEIWEHISGHTRNRDMNCKTYKMGAFLEECGLLTSIIKYSNLDALLTYCEENQIPAIFNIHSFDNENFGHYVIFIRYNNSRIILCDPGYNNGRRSIRIEELEKKFIKNDENDEIGGNIVIICSENMSEGTGYLCKVCNRENILHNDLKDKSIGFVCKFCDELNHFE